MAELSIVVPVYNVEEYLDRCVQSIRNQTFHDFEIILVDDGSPDRCPEMCDEYARSDERIKVVHKKNGGLSSARNAGMDAATGRYIGFVDSDDTIEPDMYERMMQCIQEHHTDFVMSDYKRILADGSSFLKTIGIRGGLYQKADIVKDIYPSLIMGENIDYGPLLSVWHCLYNLSFLKNNKIRFDEEVRWSEDNIFSSYVGYLAESFYYLKGQALYHYYQNKGTITTSFREGAWEVYCVMNKKLRAFFENIDDYDFSRQLKIHIIYYACNCLGQASQLPKSRRREYISEILQSKELSIAFENLVISNIPLRLQFQLYCMKHKRKKLLELMLVRRKKRA